MNDATAGGELEQSAHLPRSRALASLWLGLLGMVMYLFALNWAVFHGRRVQLLDGAPLSGPPPFPPLLASLGCVFFIVAVVISWRVRLSRLLLLAAASGLLVWAVVRVQESYG